MALTINTNIFSLTAQAALNSNQEPLRTSLQRLSTGLRINSAADDAAGLAIATGLQSQVNGDNTAITNANNGVGLLQTAEGALTTISNNLQTIRELAVESANSTNTPQDRQALNTEAQQLISEIDRVATSTQFNNVNLLNGSFSNAAFQVGANAGQTITIAQIASARTTDLRSSAPGYLTTVTGNADTILTPSATVVTAITYTTLSVGALTINHVAIGSSKAGTVSADQTSNSAWAIANAINAASGTGVKATANATVTGQLASATVFAKISSGAITINGVALGATTGSVAVASTANGVQEGLAVAKAINLISSETGVTATADSLTGRITLTAADGRDITIGNSVATTASTVGLGPVGNAGAGPRTYQGSITLTSTASSGIVIKGTSASSAGLVTGSAAATAIAQITAVADINISTASGAAAAITTVDAALNQLNLLNANLGAYQNRFESAITTLQNTSNNLSSAKSNIQDADYAVETSNLTKALITQQAGISILAQANTLPQYILALLPKG